MDNSIQEWVSQKLARLHWRWQFFWMKKSGVSIPGRIACRLAAVFIIANRAEPRAFLKLAYITDRPFIFNSASLFHSNLVLKKNVYIAQNVEIKETGQSGLVELGYKVAIHPRSVLHTGDNGSIVIGDESSVHQGCQIKSYVEPIIIGKGVMIAANSALYSYDHAMYPDLPIRKQPLVSKGPIVIQDDVWIGTGAIVLSGVTIGSGAVVAAGSVVARDIPPEAIAAGNPARVIKYRKDFSF